MLLVEILQTCMRIFATREGADRELHYCVYWVWTPRVTNRVQLIEFYGKKNTGKSVSLVLDRYFAKSYRSERVLSRRIVSLFYMCAMCVRSSTHSAKYSITKSYKLFSSWSEYILIGYCMDYMAIKFLAIIEMHSARRKRWQRDRVIYYQRRYLYMA